MPSGVTHRAGGLFVRPVQGAFYLVCESGAPGAEDVLTLADILLRSLIKASGAADNAHEVYRQALRQELAGEELITRAGEHQLPLEMERRVMLFYLRRAETETAFETLGELLPLSDTDALVEMDRHTVALVKDMRDMGEDELYQFASAIQETLQVEASQSAQIGVGNARHTLSQLGESYREARSAIDIGRVFAPDESIFLYQRMMLSRFLASVSPEEGARYHALLFNRKTSKLFSDDMLQCIDMFFHKDLNVADAARQLFIHRNTLVYRLDKVRSVTWLDLRRFDDAVTFKVLYELGKRGKE